MDQTLTKMDGPNLINNFFVFSAYHHFTLFLIYFVGNYFIFIKSSLLSFKFQIGVHFVIHNFSKFLDFQLYVNSILSF